MANQITDNRTNVFSFESLTGVVDLGGAGAGTLDAEIFVQGANSVGLYTTNSIDGLMYDAGAAQDWSGNVFYIWVNCGIVGLLATKAAGGMRIRFCGATVTDFFEVYVGGNDSWPATVSGGWAQFVVDIDDAHLNASAIGGTKPATTAIRFVGMASVTGGTMPRMADNTWIDEIQRLPANTPGIIIEGRNAGLTDWDSADIFTQLGVSVGTFVPAPGGAWKVNTPIQFGINDTTTHAFTDTNSIWLWDNQEFIDDTLYKLSALGNVGGTTNITLGAKTGTGNAASGSQGLTIAADGAGARWDIDFNDPNLDGVNFYGCSLQHGGDFLLDDIAVSFISTLYIDCASVLVSNSEQLKCSVINAATIAGAAFMTTDDLTDIVLCSFEYSAGHGIELTTPLVASQTSDGNTFTGYLGTPGSNLVASSGSNGAAIYNNAVGAVSVSIVGGGDSPSVRNGASATTTIVISANYTINNIKNLTEITILDRDVSLLDITGTASNQNVGDVAASEKVGQSFQVGTAGKAERIRLNLRKVGTPTDGIRVRLTNGVPGSTELLVSTYIPADDLTTAYVEFDVDLDGKSSLALATTYGIEIERSGALDGVNYYQVEYDTASVHASGVRYLFNVTWGTTTGDLLFSVMEAASDNELYQVESVTTGTTTWSHDGTIRTIEVLAMSLAYNALFYLDDVDTNDKTQAIAQQEDRVYSNP